MAKPFAKAIASKLLEALHVSFQARASLIGATAEIQSDTGETWAALVGHADLLQPNSLFPLYSITKTFIAVSVLKLAEARLINLDVPFSGYLPTLPFSSEFTARQLLNHTSGLPDYGSLPEYHEGVKRAGGTPWTFDEFVERTLTEGLKFSPGTGWGYSNIGYMFLSRLIERVEDETVGEAFRQLIFAPLNLPQAFVLQNLEEMKSLTPGHSLYLSTKEEAVDVRYIYDPRWVAHGVIAATASEVVTFYQELFNGNLLSSASLDQMLELIKVGASHPHFVAPSYGLGLMSDPDSRHGPLYGHTGEGPGYCGAVYRRGAPGDAGVTVGILCNSEGATNAEGMVIDLLDAFCIGQSGS